MAEERERLCRSGFTVNERRRFSDIISSARLVDAYRLLHGDKSSMAGQTQTQLRDCALLLL
jgi:hypothetical protein